MAGVLVSGCKYELNGSAYAIYKKSIVPYFEKWKIPIEGYKWGKPYISPIWPALFSLKMPEEFKEYWYNIDNAFNANLYSAILWKTYVGNNFKRNGIPYLKCRRWIYYHHKCEEGAMKKLEMLRLKKGLVELDYLVRDMIRVWSGKVKKIKNIK